MRCNTGLEGLGRCMEEEGHDTGVGTPHRFPAPPPVTAEQAAAELSAALGVPCTAVRVPPDDGDITCASVDDTPEGAACQFEALWAESDRRIGGGVPMVRRAARRARVLAAILAFLRRSETDWHALHNIAMASAGKGGAPCDVEDSKQLHDAQLAELFEAMGGAM